MNVTTSSMEIEGGKIRHVSEAEKKKTHAKVKPKPTLVLNAKEGNRSFPPYKPSDFI
jgi:hypothetical protein